MTTGGLIFARDDHGGMVIADFLHGAGKVSASGGVADGIHDGVFICACTK
jgi:hypothetical protein